MKGPRPVVLVLLVGLTSLFGHVTATDSDSFAVDPEELHDLLKQGFGSKRNHLEPEGKDEARRFIRNYFNKLKHDKINSVLKEQSFERLVGDATTSPSWQTGINYIYTLQGSKWGTAEDKPMILGAHYDTEVNTPGVDDNGSGMAALLSAAKYISNFLKTNDYTLNYTLIFVAFDYEEIADVNATDYDKLKGLLGSDVFVNEYLGPEVLDKFNLTSESVQGSIILETCMNWNSTNNSAIVADGVETLYPTLYQEQLARGFPGDFISVSARVHDTPLAEWFSRQWALSALSDKYLALVFPLPITSRPSDLSPEYWALAYNSFRSDHYRFWNYGQPGDPGLKSIMLTDTANFRGTMEQCYHNPCDDLDAITEEKLEFLAKITHTVIQMMLETSQPTNSSSPKDFKLWLSLVGFLLVLTDRFL